MSMDKIPLQKHTAMSLLLIFLPLTFTVPIAFLKQKWH
jgi:hypothetical protein